MALTPGPEDLICSARGCTALAVEAIVWRNPKLHLKRHKTWMTCAEHADFLEKYLAYREFEMRRVPLSRVDEDFDSLDRD